MTPKLLIGLIMVVAFGLRLTNLTYHSLWFDEAVSVRWATTNVPTILDVSMNLVEDRLPPVYYLLLYGWHTLSGISEFALRYLSVAFGTLLAAVVYTLGRRMFRSGAYPALLAAALISLSPFLIWYSQEARMYALAVLESTLAVLLFVRAVQKNRLAQSAWGWWLGFGVMALLGLYTHLYTGFLLPALAVWLLLHPTILKRVWWRFGVVMSGVTVLFLPLALANWRFSGESTPGDPLNGLVGRATGLLDAFTVWQAALPADWRLVINVIIGGLALIGGVVALKEKWGRLAVLLLVTPFVIASLLMLRSDLAFFGPRYFIVMVPWLLLLTAYGVTAIYTLKPNRVGMAFSSGLAGLVLLATALPIAGQWSPVAAKEAWRQTLTYMSAHVSPADGIVIHPEWVRFPYQYYEKALETPGQTYAAFFAVDAQTDLDGPLRGMLNEHPVMWLVQSHINTPDPDRRVENWFAARYPLATELYPPGIILKAYVPGYQLTNLPADATPMDASLSHGLRLVGFQVPQTRLPATDDLFHPPSNWLHVTLYWQAASTGASDQAAPYVQLIDAQGQVWGASLTRGNDSLAFYPPSRWQTEQIIRHDLDVNLNPVTPPGDYTLIAGVGETAVPLGIVTITP